MEVIRRSRPAAAEASGAAGGHEQESGQGQGQRQGHQQHQQQQQQRHQQQHTSVSGPAPVPKGPLGKFMANPVKSTNSSSGGGAGRVGGKGNSKDDNGSRKRPHGPPGSIIQHSRSPPNDRNLLRKHAQPHPHPQSRVQSQPHSRSNTYATGQSHGQHCPVQQQWPTAKDMAIKATNGVDPVSLAASSGSASTAQYSGFDSDDDFVLDEATLAIMDGRAVSAPPANAITGPGGQEIPASEAGFAQLSPDDFVLDETTLALMDGFPPPSQMSSSGTIPPSFALAPVSANTLPGTRGTGEVRKRGAESSPQAAAQAAATKQRGVSVLYTDD